jgi:16S rRNA (cytosine1402-N4)-methyltransferase
VIGFDWDEEAMAQARRHLAGYQGRIEFVRRNFAEMREALDELGIGLVDGLLLDLGLSSLQLDTSGRGFSFQGSEPLDMRMDDRTAETAADLLNRASEDDLADIFYFYGEERQARRIAAWVADARKKTPLATTDQLVRIVEDAVPPKFRPKKIHVATKVFQALRIAVNGELANLEKILDRVPDIVKPGGRICVISFHSLEDRLVKRTFRNHPDLVPVTAKPIVAADQEVLLNPRSRSARLRAAAVREQ